MGKGESGAATWMRGLFGGGSKQPAPHPGGAIRSSGRRALLRTELSITEAVCHLQPGPGREFEPIGENAFGRPVRLSTCVEAPSVVATVHGWALTGLRATGFVPGDRLSGAALSIRQAVERRVPMVLHVTLGDSHDDWHVVADTGACMLFARDLQHAVDLALLARCVAEEALTPVLVAVEETETDRAVSDVCLEPAESIREIVGDPSSEIDAPTPAQLMLFGARRRRVPRWFDLERPTAHGIAPEGPDHDALAVGRRVFFSEHTAAALERAETRLAGLTGRPLLSIDEQRSRAAKHVLVLQGATSALAQAVAEQLRLAERSRVGVLGVDRLRPFPAEPIRRALSRAESVTVLERLDAVAGDTPPLWREIRAALPASGCRLLSATYTHPRAAAIAELFRNMQRADAVRDGLRLCAPSRGDGSSYPKQEVLLQRLRRDYPGLGDGILAPRKTLDVRPAGSVTVSLRHDEATTSEEQLEEFADELMRAAGPSMRTTSRLLRPGYRELRLTAGKQPVTRPGADVPADVALIAAVDRDPADHPLDDVAPGGWVVLASTAEPDATWDGLSASWRETVRRRELRCAVAVGGLPALTRAAVAIISGSLGSVREIPWRELPAAAEDVRDDDVPLAVRRFEHETSTHDSVARFWGEYAEPRSGGVTASVPDPYLALGGMPAATSTFIDHSRTRERVPLIDPDRCTGCGRCWVDCPDSAIAALALGTEELLDSAADRAVTATPELAGPAAEKLQRAHKQLAGRIDGRLAMAAASIPGEDDFRAAFDWLTEKMNVDDDELTPMRAAFDATLAELGALPLSVTDSFFHAAHRQQKGDGRLLMLAVNPRACQGCEICEASCPDEAVRIVPQEPSVLDAMRRTWQAWERLPDTSGRTISRAGEDPAVGPLAAVLLSRHCLYSVAGGDGAEPGSGERLAVRHVSTVLEYQMQRRLLGEIEQLRDLGERLSQAVQESLAQAASIDDLDHLGQALDTVPGGAPRLGRLLERLEDLGERNDVDLPRLRRLVRAARDVEQERRRITEGAGRARFGLVVAGRSAAEWAAGFPRNPFSVPLTVDLTGTGADLAAGLAEGLIERHVAEVHLLRRAKLLLDNPSDLPVRERELDALAGGDLTDEEMSTCPPMVILGTAEELAGTAALSRLLAGRLPVLVVLLDGCDLTTATVDPALFGLAHRGAFVLTASIAHPDHLFEGTTAALRHGGPALIHVHAPSPRRHGFVPRECVARARSAVESRTHPLLRYDPKAEGVFGTRLSLAGNPGPDRPWPVDEADHATTPAHWARGESRFEHLFAEPAEESTKVAIENWSQDSSDARGSTTPTVPGPDGRSLVVGGCLPEAVLERRAHWRMLQELAGVVTPFTERVRQGVAGEVEQEHRAALDSLKADYETRLQRLEASQVAEQAARLRARLLQLAGLAAAAEAPETEDKAT